MPKHCDSCPHLVGDIDQRDCAFPECTSDEGLEDTVYFELCFPEPNWDTVFMLLGELHARNF